MGDISKRVANITLARQNIYKKVSKLNFKICIFWLFSMDESQNFLAFQLLLSVHINILAHTQCTLSVHKIKD
jgi:hypothetical protein